MSVREEFDEIVPEQYRALFNNRDSGYTLLNSLTTDFAPDQIITSAENQERQRIWEVIGLFYMENRRFFEALQIFFGLYQHMLKWQLDNNTWTHKAMPLVWMSDIFGIINYKATSKLFMMLTTVDDSIRDEGNLNIEDGGVYFRLRFKHGMTHGEIHRYSQEFYELHTNNLESDYFLFPEYVLQQVDNEWKSEYPTLEEYSYYLTNPIYIDFLESKMSDGTGKALEFLAAYLLFCMPGSRTYNRKRQTGNTTDYDVVCSMEGPITDFRSDLSRYFICECKDWNRKADFSTVAKFCRILTSIKSNFGIIFSKEGISGEGKRRFGEREQHKAYQDSNIIILVFKDQDLNKIKNGANLISMLRTKYEEVRLDLVKK